MTRYFGVRPQFLTKVLQDVGTGVKLFITK